MRYQQLEALKDLLNEYYGNGDAEVDDLVLKLSDYVDRDIKKTEDELFS